MSPLSSIPPVGILWKPRLHLGGEKNPKANNHHQKSTKSQTPRELHQRSCFFPEAGSRSLSQELHWMSQLLFLRMSSNSATLLNPQPGTCFFELSPLIILFCTMGTWYTHFGSYQADPVWSQDLFLAGFLYFCFQFLNGNRINSNFSSPTL